MKYFNNLKAEKKELFYREPEPFDKSSNRELLAYGLGATLYMPATRGMLLKDVLSEKLQGLKAMVICLEDAVGDLEIKAAEDNLIAQIKRLTRAGEEGELNLEEIPLIFIRIRELGQMHRIIDELGQNPLLTGFVFPKFTYQNGIKSLESLKKINREYNQQLYAMPILEDKNIIYKEKRIENLLEIKELLDSYKSLILNIRIGSTDFSRLFGLRRSIATSVYDVAVVRNCIEDIVNLFARVEEQYVLSGSVWEYFTTNDSNRDLSDKALKGLIREVILDKQNALVGKTIIHPSHILPVQALYVVTHEEYLDASRILALSKEANGVIKSQYGNKMNEVKPHLNWAKKIMLQSKIFGVFKEHISYVDLLK